MYAAIQTLIAVFLVVIAVACSPSKEERAATELGVKTDAYDLANIEHLLFLHRYAAVDDKQRAALMTEAAHDQLLLDASAFPMRTYFESLLAYPNVFTLLGIANGYLKTANRLQLAQQQPQQQQAIEYYQNALDFFHLTLQFSHATAQLLHDKQHDEIAYAVDATIVCIEYVLTEASAAKTCDEVLDMSLPPALLERSLAPD